MLETVRVRTVRVSARARETERDGERGSERERERERERGTTGHVCARERGRGKGKAINMVWNLSPSIVAQALKSYTYVALWMSISITVILFNKWLLAYAGFPFPISLTLWHMFFCSSVGFLCVRVFKVCILDPS